MKVFLLSSNPDDQVFFEAAAKAAGFEYVLGKSVDEYCTSVSADSNIILVAAIDTELQYKSFEATVAQKVGLFSTAINANNIVFISDHDLPNLGVLVKSDLFGHYMHRSFTKDEIPIVGALLRNIAKERALGIENFFSTPVRPTSIKITRSTQKASVVEGLRNELTKFGFKQRMTSTISTAIDELIMNAIFDAPVDESGKHLYSQTPRSADFALSDRAMVELQVAFDGARLGICVIDQFGSLDKKKLLTQHLGKSYKETDYQMRPVSAGAGLGLSNIFRNCGGLIFTCESGSRTEVSIFFKKTDSFKDFKDQFRFLSTFMYFS